MSGSWDGGSTRAWRRARAHVFRTQGRRCALALPVCEGWADQVHHTLGKAKGDDLRYLVPACGRCNRAVGDPARAAATDPRPTPRTNW